MGSTVTTYDARAPVDPPVEISILQGDALLGQLSRVVDEYSTEEGLSGSLHDAPGAEGMAYFVDRAVSDQSGPTSAIVDPAVPLRIEVQADFVDDLRGAFAVQITDVERGQSTVTPPVFITVVRGVPIVTDLCLSLLSEDSQRLLTRLAEANGDLAVVAEAEGTRAPILWYRVETATRELGASGVDEALALASFAASGDAFEGAR